MTKKVEPFRTAILSALSELVNGDGEFTAKAVIDRAKFADGRPVGKSTIYRKREKTGEFVHQDLIIKIETAAAAKAGKPPGHDKDNGVIAKLKDEKRALEQEVAALVDQLVSQEAKLLEAQKGGREDQFRISGWETDNYVLACLVRHLAPSFQPALDMAQRFEAKYRNDQMLVIVKEEVEKQLRSLSMSNLSPIFRPGTPRT